MGVSEQYLSVRSKLDAVCASCGRKPEDVSLVSVSKTTDVDHIRQAMQAGALDFGENRPDALVFKHAALPDARWHFIGNIQSRRIPDIVSCAHIIHSVFKSDHLVKIDRAAAALGKVQDVFVEVNVSGEQAKGGIDPVGLEDLLESAYGLNHVRVRGLMTMAPQGDFDAARRCFAELRCLRDWACRTFPAGAKFCTELSMGMSEDWPIAVQEGATFVRVGRAVFQEGFH